VVQKSEPGHPEYGDQYLYASFCRDSKLIINHRVAKRRQDECDAFVVDIKHRLANPNVQFSSDCWIAYKNHRGAFAKTFSETSSYGTVFKQYGKAVFHNRFSAKVIQAFHRKAVWGNPDRSKICTSYIERQNLNFRLFNKRFARQSICFSKKLANLKHSVALTIAYHNFCRKHGGISGRTPAMAAGLTDHVWAIRELLEQTTAL
jgi:IS1 family transposase